MNKIDSFKAKITRKNILVNLLDVFFLYLLVLCIYKITLSNCSWYPNNFPEGFLYACSFVVGLFFSVVVYVLIKQIPFLRAMLSPWMVLLGYGLLLLVACLIGVTQNPLLPQFVVVILQIPAVVVHVLGLWWGKSRMDHQKKNVLGSELQK